MGHPLVDNLTLSIQAVQREYSGLLEKDMQRLIKQFKTLGDKCLITFAERKLLIIWI